MRIALVAMSGTGAYDVGRAGKGFEGAAFVARHHAIQSLPSLAMLTLAGMTGKPHEVAYYEVMDPDAHHLPLDQFDAVALTSYSAQIFNAYKLARECRAHGIPTIIGGPHVSCLPEEAAQYCDAVAVGEGESCWPEILADLEAGRLEQFYGSLKGTFDLRNAPMPAFELLGTASTPKRVSIQTSRGCPHRCEFCASSTLLSGRYKQKPAGKVLAEIDRVCALWSRPFIEFTDDNTFVNRAYWAELLPEFARRKIRWFAEADLSLGRDEELVEWMCQSGCRQVLLGIESPFVADLHGLELRNDWKAEQTQDARDVVRVLQSRGIMVVGCFVFGLDSQGPDVFDAVYDFVRDTSMYDIQITYLTPFPGTPLYDRLRAEGRLLIEAAWDRCTLFDINFQPKRMSAEELAEGFANLAIRLYDDGFTRQRRRNLRRQLRGRIRRSTGSDSAGQ